MITPYTAHQLMPAAVARTISENAARWRLIHLCRDKILEAAITGKKSVHVDIGVPSTNVYDKAEQCDPIVKEVVQLLSKTYSAGYTVGRDPTVTNDIFYKPYILIEW